MPGILDLLDNQDFLGQLLGAGGSNIGSGPMPQPPQPPPQLPTRAPPPAVAMQQAPPDPTGSGMPAYNPSTATNGIGLNVGFAPGVSYAAEAPPAAPPPQAGGAVPLPQPRPPGAPGPQMAGGGSVPLPQPRPPMPAPMMTNTARPDITASVAPGAPLDINAPGTNPNAMLPANSTSTMGPNMVPGGGLARQMGATMPAPPYAQPQASPLGRALKSLGAGLTAVGRLRPGANAAQAFAAGAGGALEGGDAYGQRQFNQQFEAQKNFFNETISADNQLMKDKAFPYNIAHLAASTNYLNGRLNQGGAMGSNAWQLSDIGRMHMADQEADKEYQNQLTALRANTTAGLISADDAQKRFQMLEQNREQMRNKWYQRYKVDPDNTQGTEKNPIDGTKLTDYQLRTMPPGTYFSYKDKDGKTVVGQRSTDQHNGGPQPQTNPGVDAAVTQNVLQQPAGPQGLY